MQRNEFQNELFKDFKNLFSSVSKRERFRNPHLLKLEKEIETIVLHPEKVNRSQTILKSQFLLNEESV